MKSRLPIPPNTLERFCRKHRIRRLSLFGSVLKGTAGSNSDIDLLVEFEPGGKPGLLQLAAMEDELSTLAGGRRVDLAVPVEIKADPYAVGDTRLSSCLEKDGVRVFTKAGEPIGHIHLPERCANVVFGGLKRNRLFMASCQSVYALYVNTQGVPYF